MLLVVLPFAFFVTLPQFGQSYSSMSVGNRYNKPFPKSIHINTNCLSHNLHSLYSVHRDTDEFESNKKDGTRRKKKIVEENIPGKTSAIPGAKDYEINIPQTEQKWFEQADDAERKVKEFTAKGMNALKLLRLDEAALAFDMVYRLNPNAYCWHYGIVLFYLGKYHEAAQLFSHNAKQCEFKFEIPASEERIWYSACCLKARGKGSFDGKQKRRKKSTDEVIAPLEENKDAIYETRKVIRIARDLFEASVMGDGSSVALARAQLHSVAVSGASPNSGIPRIAGTLGSNIDRKMWKLSAWYYLGLHYDSLGNEKESKKCIKMALRQCATSGNGVDVMHILPMLHMTVRDWYDDDDFEEDIQLEDNKVPVSQKIIIPMHETSPSVLDESDDFSGVMNEMTTEMTMIQSIKESIEKMKLTELQAALKKRNTKSSGSKSILQARLLVILLEESGLSQ